MLSCTKFLRAGQYCRSWLPLLLLFFLSKLCTPVSAQNGCGSLTPSFEQVEPCQYRVRIVNQSECTPSIRFILENTNYATYTVNTAGGWTGVLLAPNEIQLTHIQGFVPIGVSVPMLFRIQPGVSTPIVSLWDFTCGLGESCTVFPPPILEGCPDPQNASITGVKYRECGNLPYSNQPTLPGWPIQLFAEDNMTLLSETVTDATGGYAFFDLPYGVYWCREASKPGWTASVPASGQAQINLAASQQATQNFGNCPACSCDSVYTEIIQLPSATAPCNYVLNVSSTAPAGCFTQLNISTAAGTLSNVTGATGWNVVLVDSQHIQATYTAGYLPGGIYQPCFFRAGSASGSQEFTVTTSYSLGGQTQTCTRAAGPFPCPSPAAPPPCCPQGNTWGPELVTNPDFQSGYSGFTNGYTAVPGGAPMSAGNASVANQAQTYASNNQWSCLDNTTYSAAGLFLVVDGYAAPVVWQQTVSVTAGTTYSFYAWFNNLVRPTKNYADPSMSLFVNGSPIAGPLTLSEIPNLWVRLCGTYTAQQTGPVILSIRMAAGSTVGNDVAIDDISFRACVPPAPCQVAINVTPVNNCGLVTVTATVNGGQTASYQWCNGATGNSYTTQLPCGPHTFCVTATCPNGTTSTATVTYVVSDPIPPTCVTVPGFGVTLNQNCTYTLTPQQIDGGSTDNCQIQNLSINPTVLTGCGVTTVTLTVTDWCGNTSTCTTGVQTIETVPPVITNCPTAPVPVTTNPGVCYYQGPLPTLTATDNCGTVTNFTCNWFVNNNFVPITAATQFPKGNNTIRCHAIDNCGNTSLSCTYTLLVEDKEKPIIVCPQNVNVIGSINAVGQCKAIVNNIAAAVSDNCPMVNTSWALSGATTGTGNGDASGTNFMQGTTTVTYTATDMAGNTSTCSFTVTVACSQWACDCPQGSTNGPDLIDNGTFQLGNTLFSSGYSPLPPSCSPQEYTVTDPVQVTTLCNNWAATDHTTGNTTAGWLFFAADGSLTPGIDAWRQQVTLTAGTTYKFCAWVKNLNFNLDRPDPIVEAYVLDGSLNPIGGPIATTGLLPEPALPSGWVMIMGSFTATTSGTHYVAIRTAGTSFEGNNFALDDIAFRACSAPPSCTCPPNAFSGMSYKPNSGPNVPINCGQIAIWQCLFPTFNLSGNFMCQGNNCPTTIPMSWVLSHPSLGIVNTGSMTGPGFSVSIPNSSFTASGIYTLTLAGICGSDTCYCDIQIETPGCGCTANAGPDVMICPGQSTTLTATGGGSYLWSNGATTASTTVSPSSTTTYTVVVTVGNCSTSDQVIVTVKPAPQANAGADQLICQWQTATLTASGGGTYAWSPLGTTSNPFTTPPVQSNTTYTVTVTGANGCTATDQVNVNVKDCGCGTQNQFVQNPDFELGNPCLLGDEDIFNATNWDGIWPNNPGLSIGDFYNTTTCTPSAATGGILTTPTPLGCGQFGAFWCFPHQTNVVWREGILNDLSAPIPANSGNYMVSMKMACLRPVNGVPRMSVYGVPQLAVTTVGALTPTTPLNPALFSPSAVLLGTINVASTCNNNFMNVGFNFNSNILPSAIDRVFLTRDDPVGNNVGGNTFLAVDSFCVKPVLDTASCQCGAFEWATIQQQWTPPVSFSGCNGAFVPVPCAKPGADYFIHGNYRCSPDACGSSLVTWTLTRPSPLTPVTGTSTSPYPHYDIPLAAVLFTVSGNYTLTISRNCGNKTCTCKLNFKIEACPCLCDNAFMQSVNQGFTVSSVFLPPNQCRKRLRPQSLCPGDMVTWTVSGVGTFTSTGNAPVTVNFPASGFYNVCMTVKRTESNGTTCEKKYCREIYVKCGISPIDHIGSACEAVAVRNSGFTQGVTAGLLGETGTLANWEIAPNPGDGQVFVADSTGSLDEGHVVLIGGQENFAGVQQSVDLVPDNFTILNFEAINYLGGEMPVGTRIELRLQEEPFAFPNMKKQVLAVKSIPVDSGGWVRYSMLMPSDFVLDTSLHHFVICLQNDDPAKRSIVGIDNIEFCTRETSDVGDDVEAKQVLRLYPNPNAGTFTVRLSQVARPDTRFRITDLTGRLVTEQAAQTGSDIQYLDVRGVPNGLYFVQVLEAGRLVAVEKFVVQRP